MTTISLNDLCSSYAQHLNSIPVELEIINRVHVPGFNSVYILHIDLFINEVSTRYWYVGRTATDPSSRAAKHKSSFRNCRVSTFVGTSSLFTPALLNVTSVNMEFIAVKGEMSVSEAKELEKELSTKLRFLFSDAVLTKPNGAASTLKNLNG